VYTLTAVLERDGDGYCVSVAEIPGIVSQGDTEREALEHIKEAATGALEIYRDERADIPWRSDGDARKATRGADKHQTFTVTIDG
jgi:predicted RNase H-like HicB family nuclease